MGLTKYLKKRNFKETNEPQSGKSSEMKLQFVVQRHHASHLHYDFRLEMGGVLKSWAIPKGPSLNPKDKRLAMMVEDHPFDYKDFEGTIPAGNYGGGVVHIFDKGTYTSLISGGEKELLQELKAGNLKFKLNGKILKGEFALVKLKSDTDNNAWLLIKHKDKYAVDKSFNSEDLVAEKAKQEGIDFKKKPLKDSSKPLSYQPMLATLADTVFDDPDWIYEKKLDGYRSLAYLQTNGSVRLISRNGKALDYPSITSELKKIKEEAVLDGELVAEDKKGVSKFQALQNYSSSTTETLRYYVFDVLNIEGQDVSQLELLQRKELLTALLKKYKFKNIIITEFLKEKGSALFKKAEDEKWEGIIGKKGSGSYVSNKRSPEWLKFKITQSQEAVIIGFTKPSGSRKYFGALALAMYDGVKLKYIGNCGTGFNEQTLKNLYDQLFKLKTKNKPVIESVNLEKNITWVRPILVCDITYAEFTNDHHLRHPVFKGLRIDKDPKSATLIPAERPQLNSMETTTNEKQIKFGNKLVKLTNLKKIYWPKEQITKGTLIEYYDELSDVLLPHLKNKPLSLNRHPNGIDKPGFFQKDLNTEQIPKWIKYASLYSESNNKNIDYLICNDKATLLWMVNLGCIEINPWLSEFKKPEIPTYAVLDLDPHDLDFKHVIDVALYAKEIFDKMQIKAFIKTSGSKGLHIFIPVSKGYSYEITKNFIWFLGEQINKKFPETTSLERTPSKRKNKIYLDFLQNRRGQTIAAPYSVRPKAGATVSMPIKWEEVNYDLKLSNYTIFNAARRIEKEGDLWGPIFKVKNNLQKALLNFKS